MDEARKYDASEALKNGPEKKRAREKKSKKKMNKMNKKNEKNKKNKKTENEDNVEARVLDMVVLHECTLSYYASATLSLRCRSYACATAHILEISLAQSPRFFGSMRVMLWQKNMAFAFQWLEQACLIPHHGVLFQNRAFPSSRKVGGNQ